MAKHSHFFTLALYIIMVFSVGVSATPQTGRARLVRAVEERRLRGNYIIQMRKPTRQIDLVGLINMLAMDNANPSRPDLIANVSARFDPLGAFSAKLSFQELEKVRRNPTVELVEEDQKLHMDDYGMAGFNTKLGQPYKEGLGETVEEVLAWEQTIDTRFSQSKNVHKTSTVVTVTSADLPMFMSNNHDANGKKLAPVYAPGEREEILHDSMNDINEDKTMIRIAAATNFKSPLGGMWGLDRIDQRVLPYDGHAIRYIGDGEGVDVYVVDTGIELDHTEFEGGRVKHFYSYSTPDSMDHHGHGTHVAGIIGGKTRGVSKKATIYAVKVLGADGLGSITSLLAGMTKVLEDHNKKRRTVLSMSLDGIQSNVLDAMVMELVNKNLVVVTSAGNLNQNSCNYSPAASETAITVGATTVSDSIAAFSNWGPCVDVFAPGQSIMSSWIGNSYKLNSGTSMACPFVTGAIANYLSLNPTASAQQVKAAIADSVTVGQLNMEGKSSNTPNKMLYVLFGKKGYSDNELATPAASFNENDSSDFESFDDENFDDENFDDENFDDENFDDENFDDENFDLSLEDVSLKDSNSSFLSSSQIILPKTVTIDREVTVSVNRMSSATQTCDKTITIPVEITKTLILGSTQTIPPKTVTIDRKVTVSVDRVSSVTQTCGKTITIPVEITKTLLLGSTQTILPKTVTIDRKVTVSVDHVSSVTLTRDKLITIPVVTTKTLILGSTQTIPPKSVTIDRKITVFVDRAPSVTLTRDKLITIPVVTTKTLILGSTQTIPPKTVTTDRKITVSVDRVFSVTLTRDKRVTIPVVTTKTLILGSTQFIPPKTVTIDRKVTVSVDRVSSVTLTRDKLITIPVVTTKTLILNRHITVKVDRPLTVSVPVDRPLTMSVPVDRPTTVSVEYPVAVTAGQPSTVTVNQPITISVDRPTTVSVDCLGTSTTTKVVTITSSTTTVSVAYWPIYKTQTKTVTSTVTTSIIVPKKLIATPNNQKMKAATVSNKGGKRKMAKRCPSTRAFKPVSISVFGKEKCKKMYYIKEQSVGHWKLINNIDTDVIIFNPSAADGSAMVNLERKKKKGVTRSGFWDIQLAKYNLQLPKGNYLFTIVAKSTRSGDTLRFATDSGEPEYIPPDVTRGMASLRKYYSAYHMRFHVYENSTQRATLQLGKVTGTVSICSVVLVGCS